MGTLFVYIVKAATCLAAFYLFYRLLLSKETFHRFNRIALLSILILSLVIPFFEITVESNTEIKQNLLTVEQLLAMADFTPRETATVMAPSPPRWIPILLTIYLLGILFFFGRNLYSLIHMIHVLRHGKKEKIEHGITRIIHDQEIAPFSWMKYIVISEKDKTENGREILAHEIAHIRHHHSIDLLIADICICFQWFNPASWLLKQELQNIHEYEADESVIRQGINAKQYQLLLIKKAVGTRLYSMANSFNHSKLKKRITMMLKEKSNPWARVKYLYVLPLAAISMVAFARPEITNELNEISAVKVNDFTSILEKKEVNNSIPTQDTIRTKNKKKAQTKRDSVTIVTYTKGDSIVYRLKSDGQHIKNDSNLSARISATSKVIGPISFTISEEKFILDSTKINIVVDTITNSSRFSDSIILPLFFVEGKEVSEETIRTIDPEQIKSITILKDNVALATYGERAKNGVVVIELLHPNETSKITVTQNLTSNGMMVTTRDENANVIDCIYSMDASKKASKKILQKKFIEIIGLIKDENNKPIHGAQIFVKDLYQTITTGSQGKFKLYAPLDTELNVSYPGMKVIKIKATPSMDIQLIKEN